MPFDDGPGGPGGWWILDEPELHLGEHIVVPDLAGWRRQRLAALPEEAFFSLAPDWVCEVLSPSTESMDRRRKLPIYAEAGVTHAWLVKPAEKMLEVLRLRDGAWTIVVVCGDADTVRVEPFDAIELELRRLWSDSPPRPWSRIRAWKCSRSSRDSIVTSSSLISGRSSALPSDAFGTRCRPALMPWLSASTSW